MQRIKTLLADNWQSIAVYAGLFAVLAGLLLWQLGSLTPGYAEPEVFTHDASIHLGKLLENPLNAPYLVLVKTLSYVVQDSYLATRLASVAVGLVILGAFCWLVRQWYDERTSVIGTLLLGTSAGFLHAARLGTPEIALMGTILLVAAGFWLKQSRGWLPLALCFALAACLLYTPGMVWLLLVGIIWQWKTIDRLFKDHLIVVSAGALLLIAALVPLGWGLFKDQSLITVWLGLPKEIPNPIDFLIELAKVPYHLVISNAPDPIRWLGTAPILDVFSVAMFIIGVIGYVKYFRLIRTRLLTSLLAVSTIIIALGIQGGFGLILPILYLVIASGAGTILSQWLKVFPRNPIARSIGMTLLGLVVLMACTYHTWHYFVGWPQAQATHDVYTLNKQ
jgi:hypothetical protein